MVIIVSKKIMNIMFVLLITIAPVLSMANTNAGAEIRTASLEVQHLKMIQNYNW